MRARAGLLLLAAAVAAVVLLAGCSDDEGAAGAHVAGSGSRPTPGGEVPDRVSPPAHSMDGLEKQVLTRLGRRVAAEGLTLEYLDCPRWDGSIPSRMTCRAYVDGLVAQARVALSAGAKGEAVTFDARVAEGLIVTHRLEETLRGQGRSTVDCGEAAAYPARVGSRVVCRVARGERRSRYVVATVTKTSGAVTIAEYQPREDAG